MKKLYLLFIVAAIIFTSCLTLDNDYEPELPNDSAYLIDLKTVGYPEDYVKFHNCTSEDHIDVRVYAFNRYANKWEIFGVASLDGLNDIDTIYEGPFSRNDLEDYRYIAIQFRSDEDYDFTTSNIRDDLHIYLLDQGDEW